MDNGSLWVALQKFVEQVEEQVAGLTLGFNPYDLSRSEIQGAGEFTSKFKDTFRQSIRRAIEAYPEAKVELTAEGLVMQYSDPVDLRRAFVALPGEGGTLPRQRTSRRQLRRIEQSQTNMSYGEVALRAAR